MSIRITLLLQFGRQAWSESHYDIAATDVTTSTARATVLANLRAAMLGFDSSVFGARISDPDNPGAAELLRFNPAIQGQKVNINIGFITSFTSDNTGLANDAVLVDAGGSIGAHFHRSRPMLGGPPAGLIQSVAGVPTVVLAECPDWAKAFNAWSAQLIGFGWGFRVSNEGTSYKVQGVTGGAGVAPIGLTVDNAFTPAPQTLIHVRGFRVHPLTRVPLAGLWRVLATVAGPGVGTNSIQLANSLNMPAALSYMLPGSVSTTAAAIAPYEKYDVATGATRKRGGNLDLPRGRSRTRV